MNGQSGENGQSVQQSAEEVYKFGKEVAFCPLKIVMVVIFSGMIVINIHVKMLKKVTNQNGDMLTIEAMVKHRLKKRL